MSTSNEIVQPSVQTSPTPKLEIPLPQENKLICGICESDIATNHKHLICAKDKCRKATCSECINTMIGILFAEPTLNYPLKCGACRTPFNNTAVETLIVDEESYEKYIACILPLYWSQDCLNDCEVLVQCKYIEY